MNNQLSATTKTEGAATCGPKRNDSVLKVLFDAYLETNSEELEDALRCYSNLRTLLDGISHEKMEDLTDAMNILCDACEYAGFIGGIHTGMRLASELNI